MKRATTGALISLAMLAFVAAVSAEELTVSSILAAQRSGVSAENMIALVNRGDNSVAMSAADIVTLRDAGVPERVLTVIWARIPAPPPAAMPLQPDDARLVDFVRLIKSGASESIIAEQVKQSQQTYRLSVNDLLYLKENGAHELTIAALMATGSGAVADPTAPAVAPLELVFDDLVWMRPTFLKKNRVGRLVMRGDVLAWEDRNNPKMSFTFQIPGVDSVWYTCKAGTAENFCFQINFKIVKGDHFRFQDRHRDTGSKAAVLKVMEALRLYFPRLNYKTSNVDDD
jgi:hypothetical protein